MGYPRFADSDEVHFGLTPHCGICGTVMVVGEKCTALFGTNRATAYQRRIEAFDYPKFGALHGEWGLDDKTLLCRNPLCAQGTESLESCTVHIDCLALFQQHCAPGKEDALDRLWIAAAWRRPWRQVPWLWLDQPDSSPVSIAWPADTADTADTVATAGSGGHEHDSLSHLAMRLQRLSPEIVQMIRAQSADSLLWRYSVVLDRARYVASHVLPEGPLSVPLTEIAAWERGGASPLDASAATSAAHLPIIRLTIDARGLRSIERLPSKPTSRSWRSFNLAFVVVDESEVRGVAVLFKFGLARLDLPAGMKGLQVWDTPTPPKISDVRLVLKTVKPKTRFQTIPLDKATGVTLFFEYTKVFTVHMHTPSTPIARMTHLSLDPHNVVWVYVPIAANDRILAFGVRRTVERLYEDEDSDENDYDEDDERYDHPYSNFSMCFLFRTQLVGDVSVGPMLPGPLEDIPLASAPPVTLVFSAIESTTLSVAGAYETSPSPPVDDPKPVAPLAPFGDPPSRTPSSANDLMTFLSSAPLAHVVHLRIFTDRDFDFCRGILLVYENGGQRAVGQCRIGIDPVCEYERPVCLCVRRMTYTYMVKNPVPRQPGIEHWQVIRAQATSIDDHDHDKPVWDCYHLRGQLQCWFGPKRSLVTVVDDE